MRTYLAALCLYIPLSQFANAQQPADVSDFSRGQLFNLEIRRVVALEQGAEFSLPLPFSFPADARPDSIFGVDVSHHNFDRCKCKANWEKAASSKVVFAYIKATQGTRYVDPTFKDNWSNLTSSNIHRGAYHFLSSDGDALEQARHFVESVRAAGGVRPADMPPSLDVEWETMASRWIFGQTLWRPKS
jgi:lysozyme